MTKLAFNVRKFHKLFTLTKEKTRVLLNDGEEKNYFSSYFEVRNVNNYSDNLYLNIKPAEELLSFLRGMLVEDNDDIHLDLIVFEDGGSSLYAKYTKINGDRLLAKFSAKETRQLVLAGALMD